MSFGLVFIPVLVFESFLSSFALIDYKKTLKIWKIQIVSNIVCFVLCAKHESEMLFFYKLKLPHWPTPIKEMTPKP